ncbi:hypothetical protein DPX16_9001 [Anabarilius grahami]|uniref:Uncharacterized protein n=1 Tax=Anabarilius grahami TaxID=495550 RepID=A0A3N0XCR8_ANAGA|nr:hypothetical protein DPX16_9001 [Anabarilius grahami]
MNPAVDLLWLRQGNRPLEDYVKLCELSCQVEFNDVALKDMFQCGLNEHLAYLMPDNTSHWTLAQYIDFVLLLSGSSFTMGFAYEEPCNPTVLTTPECLHSPSIMSGVIHAMPVQPEPVHIMSTKPESLHIMPAKPEFVHVKPAKPETVHVIPATPEPLYVMLATPESTAIMVASPEPPHMSVQVPLEPLELTVGEFMFSSQVAKPSHAKSLIVLCLIMFKSINCTWVLQACLQWILVIGAQLSQSLLSHSSQPHLTHHKETFIIYLHVYNQTTYSICGLKSFAAHPQPNHRL